MVTKTDLPDLEQRLKIWLGSPIINSPTTIMGSMMLRTSSMPSAPWMVLNAHLARRQRSSHELKGEVCYDPKFGRGFLMDPSVLRIWAGSARVDFRFPRAPARDATSGCILLWGLPWERGRE